MKKERGRLHDVPERTAVLQVERDLMCRAGRRHRDRAAPADLDGSMEMPAEDPLDLRMSADDLGQALAAVEAVLVHVLDTRPERRVMHIDDGRAVGRLGQ